MKALEPPPEEGPARTTAQRVALAAFWVAAATAAAGTFMFFVVDLHHYHELAGSLLAALPGMIMTVSLIPPARSLARRLYRRAAGWSILAMVLAVLIGPGGIVGLQGECHVEASCRKGGGLVTVVGTGQILFLAAVLAAIIGALTAIAIAVARARDARRYG